MEIFGPARGVLLEESLDVRDSSGLGKGGFAEFHVERFFKRAHQFNAIERGEAQRFLERTRGRRSLTKSSEQSFPWPRLRFPKATRLTAVQDFGGPCGDQWKARFTRRSARKIKLRPGEPALDALILSKRRIRSFDDRACSRLARILHQQNRAGFGVAGAFERNHHRITDAGLPVECLFQILGVNIQPCRRYDDIFLAPAKTEVALCVHFPQVTGREPATFACRQEHAIFPVAGGHAFTAHQNLAVARQLRFEAWKNLADRAFGRAKRVVQADKRGGFRHPIALNHRVAHALEETLGVGRESRAAGDEGPEFPAKTAMYPAKHPGTSQKAFSAGSFERTSEPA